MVDARSHRRSRWSRRRIGALVAWLLVAAWAVVIFAMSAKSGLELDTGTGIVSQVKRWLAAVLSEATGQQVDPSPIGHFGEYLVFGALLVNAARYRLPAGKAALASVGIAAIYAATDEFHQMFVPGRACDPLDWLVDMAAVALAALIGWLVLRMTTGAGGGATSGGARSAKAGHR